MPQRRSVPPSSPTPKLLVEAPALSLAVGAAGILIEIAASVLIGELGGWGFQFNAVTPVMAAGFSLLVGVVFGGGRLARRRASSRSQRWRSTDAAVRLTLRFD